MSDQTECDPDPRGSSAFVRWFTSFPLTILAGNSLFAGLILSVCEAAGWIGWGHEVFLVALVPVIAWALALWMAERQ